MEETIVSVVGDMVRACPGAISLGQGVVHYPPPPEALEGARRFLEKPHHKYSPVPGLPELIEAAKAKLLAENAVTVGPGRRVMITAGANMGFVNALMAVTDPGDEVIVPMPYYFNHTRATAMAGCRAVSVPTDASYQLDPAAIRRAVTPKTRVVVTVSPNNPSGAVYTEASLREVNLLCREKGLYHVCDEAYEYFTYGGVRHFSPASIPGSEPYTISLYSLSKAYGFASWRIGYMVVPAHLFEEVEKVQDVLVICPPTISQYAALGALRAGPDYCRRRVREMEKVRALVLEELSKIGNICHVPRTDGAFYFLIGVDTDMDQMTLVERLIKEYGVGVVPGRCCGLDRKCHLRVSYGGLAGNSVAEGIGRLVKGLSGLVS